MISHWPVSLPQKPRRGTWNGGPKDFRRKFQPEIGPPLFRRGSTAEVMAYSQVVFPNLDAAQRTAFETFYATTLAGGTLPFSWRDPDTDVPGLWIIEGGDLGYSLSNRGANLRDLTLNLIRRPGTPWWSPYLRPNSSRVPYAVADYTGSVFGVDALRTAASAVAAVAGTYDVYTTATPSGLVTEELAHVVVAGDIPATAPGGVSRIVAFIP